MTSREKQVVRESFEAVREEAGPISLLFYGRLFQTDPSLRPMFRGDIARQGQKLMDMLAVVVDSLNRFEAIAPALHAMGQRHTAYGVLPRHYEFVEQAFTWALSQALATTSRSEEVMAWRTLIREVSSMMQAGADQLRTGEPTSSDERGSE